MRLPVTETVKVILSRPWGPYPDGAEVEVDAARAGTLDEQGYLARPETVERPRRRKREE